MIRGAASTFDHLPIATVQAPSVGIGIRLKSGRSWSIYVMTCNLYAQLTVIVHNISSSRDSRGGATIGGGPHVDVSLRLPRHRYIKTQEYY